MNSWRTVQLGSGGMPCLSVSAAAGSSAGSTTKTYPLTAYVTGIYQSGPLPWMLVTPKQKLHLVCSQIIVASALCQEHPGPWLCHVLGRWMQESPRMRSSDTHGQCWDLFGFLPISLGMFY